MQEVIYLILGMAAVTYGIRYLLLALAGSVTIPHGVVRALKYIPPCVLTAIIAPEVLAPQGELNPLSLELACTLISIVIVVRTKNVLLAIGLSVGCYVGFKYLQLM